MNIRIVPLLAALLPFLAVHLTYLLGYFVWRQADWRLTVEDVKHG